jgi:hypothetical protein
VCKAVEESLVRGKRGVNYEEPADLSLEGGDDPGDIVQGQVLAGLQSDNVGGQGRAAG